MASVTGKQNSLGLPGAGIESFSNISGAIIASGDWPLGVKAGVRGVPGGRNNLLGVQGPGELSLTAAQIRRRKWRKKRLPDFQGNLTSQGEASS